MGTPPLAATVLEALAAEHEVVAAYTRPDAVRGRGKALVGSAVKEAASRLGIEVRTPRTLRDAEEQRALAALAPDAICVAAYGVILPRAVLECARFGCLNVHASLLPRWRGAAPIERAILAGDEETGVCIMRMEEGLDTGAWCARRATPVGEKTASDLTSELALLGSEALAEALAGAEAGTLSWTEQDEALVTYAEKIGKHELALSPAEAAVEVWRKVRASADAHPARAVVAGRAVRVTAAALVDDAARSLTGALAPGEARFAGKRLFLGCADAPLEVRAVRPDGKKEMDAASFAAGIQGAKGAVLTWEEEGCSR